MIVNVELEQQLRMIGELLVRRSWMLATAESCTGGGVAHAVTSIAGSSAWFERGFVTYSNLAKQQMLGVSATLLQDYGAVSESVVRAMADGALQHSAAQVSLAISGIAGPEGGTAEKPVGTVWFAWAASGQETLSRRLRLDGDRAQVRAQAVQTALAGVLDILSGGNGDDHG
jgi:nicotinamide-nucleotide amidase